MANEVTKIVAQKRAGRYNIYLDGRYAFPVSESVLIKFQITHGMEITPELEQQMLSADDVARAYQRALNYLSQQLRTEKEVHDKLVTEEIPEDVIETTMVQLREMHLVDDAEYAAAYVRTMKNTADKGPRVIRQNLRLKGIGEQLIEDALTEYPADELLETASELVAKLDRRYQRQAFKTKVQKIRQGLMTKGFSGETIDAALEAADLQPDEDDEWAGLSKMGEKLWQRNRRYAYRERLMRTKRGLFQKGYDTDDINRFMDQLSAENSED